ncbi:MAG: AAA family ATPase, partial [Dehalococcoidia bacterium]|nr:AAA family ATPase [Dehalococcoidia bacterium]
TLFIICTVLYISEDLEKDITYIDFPLPKLSEVLQLLEQMIKKYGSLPGCTVELNNDEKEDLAKAALGLTLDEATEAFSKSLVNDKRLTIDDLQEVVDQKVQVIKKTQILEYSPPEESFKAVGGLELLREWLSRRKKAFSEKAREYKLPEPKGILLVGMPGCGKSLCAKAISAEWGFPQLRLDMGRIFSVAGVTPEENLRKAIKTAETIAPCVFWVDEIEKGFPRSVASASDVSARLLGHFLTWMQEKTLPVFVFATANDIGNVPPELLRRGRFDEIFFVDFPNSKEREEIWTKQFQKYKQKAFQKSLDEKDLKKLVQLSRGFSGAEIEQCLIDAMFGAFSDRERPGRPVEFNNLIEAVRRMKPLSQSMRDELAKMRDAAELCATPASTYVAEDVDEFPLKLGREIPRSTQEETDS